MNEYKDRALDVKIPSDSRGNRFAYCCKSNGIKNTSGIIKASLGILVDLLVYTDGNNNATVIIYDNPSAASGNELAKVVVKGDELMGGEVNILCNAELGMYMSISGTGATALVRYA